MLSNVLGRAFSKTGSPVKPSGYFRTQYRRTYLESDWTDPQKRMGYIDEARETARSHRPAEVSIYVTDSPRRKGTRVVRIVAH